MVYKRRKDGKADLVDQKFGKLFVMYDTGKRKGRDNNIVWKCECECGNYIDVTSKQLTSGRTRSCGCLLSKGEAKIHNILQKNGAEFERRKVFEDCINSQTGYHYQFDFYIPEINMVIEYDGEQHYKTGGFMESLEEQQRRDREKDKYCSDNDIIILRIPYQDYEKLDFDWLVGKIIEKIVEKDEERAKYVQ